MSELQGSSQESSRWAETSQSHCNSVEEVGSAVGNTPHLGQPAPSERSCSMFPRRAPAVTIPGARALPLPTRGPAHTWMPPGRDGVNEPMGRGGRKAANGSGRGAGGTRLRSNGVLGGGARGPRANETVRLGAPRRWDSRLRRR